MEVGLFKKPPMLHQMKVQIVFVIIAYRELWKGFNLQNGTYVIV